MLEQQRPLSVVTGGTSGIGLEVVRGLAHAGHHVIVVGRSEERGRALCEEVADAGGVADFLACDVSSVRAVAAVAEELRRRYGRCDVLVNCAATPGAARREVTEEGLEVVFATNVVAYHLLAVMLMDLLEASGGRIVVVASDYAGGLRPGDLELAAPAAYSPHTAYQASKQANRMLAGALHDAIQGRGGRVVVNSMTPRLCQTPLAESMGAVNGRPASDGAKTVLFLATSTDAAALEGGWHWRDEERRRCEFRAGEGAQAEALLCAAVEAAARCRLEGVLPAVDALPWIAGWAPRGCRPGPPGSDATVGGAVVAPGLCRG